MEMASVRCKPFLWITPTRLLRDLFVADSILSNGTVDVRWTLDSFSVDRGSILGVFNYLGSLSLESLTHIVDEDRQYVCAELTSYLGFALSQFRNVINRPSCGSLSGSTESLPYQWRCLSLLAPDVATPWYEMSCERRTAPHLIQTIDFFDYANWIPGPIDSGLDSDTLVLRYERPPGIPVVCWFIDDALMYVHALTGRPWKPTRRHLHARRMAHVTRRLATRFDLRLGQALYFINRDRLTFASIMPFVSYDLANERVRAAFTERLYETLT